MIWQVKDEDGRWLDIEVILHTEHPIDGKRLWVYPTSGSLIILREEEAEHRIVEER